MKKILNVFVLSLFGLAAYAQDPTISSPTVNPSPGQVNGPVTLSVNFQNISSLPIPNPDPVDGPTTIIFSTNKFRPNFLADGITPAVTGAGAAYFDWTAQLTGIVWVITGKQKAGVTIPGSTGFPPFTVYAGGPINIPGIITAASTIANANGHTGDGFNANIQPGDGGDINPTGGSNQQSGFGYTNGILPVTLMDFTANKNGAKSDLVWNTSSEENTANFSVERSGNGVSFTAIGSVAAAGQSAVVKHYAYTDAAPLKGSNYYRLKMYDLDGSFTYSPVRLINFDKSAEISIFPVPARDYINVRGLNANAQITFTGISGQRMATLKSKSAVENINIAAWPAGTYIVTVTEDGKPVYSQQFIKGTK